MSSASPCTLIGLARIALLACLALPSCAGAPSAQTDKPEPEILSQLGAFSVSLAVKDIRASKAFYEKLDFREVGGNIDQNWLILRSGTTTIGLFQGMFEKNIMTFNPGWSYNKETLDDFSDVRELQRMFKERGLVPATEVDESGDGPGSLILTDPDGNSILLDQHVASPKR